MIFFNLILLNFFVLFLSRFIFLDFKFQIFNMKIKKKQAMLTIKYAAVLFYFLLMKRFLIFYYNDKKSIEGS